MAVMSSAPAVTHEAVSASLRVVESAVALARAETKLALARARVLATHTVALLLGGIVTMTFLALTLVIVTLSPLLLAPNAGFGRMGALGLPWPFLLSLGLSSTLALGGAWVAVSAFRRIKSARSDDGGEP